MKTIKKILLFFAAMLPVVSCNNKEEADKPAELTVEGLSSASEEVIFEYGEKKEWTLHTANVANVHVSFPEGWKASADLNSLVIEAPKESDAEFTRSGYVFLSYTSNSGEVGKLPIKVGLVKPNLTFEIEVSEISNISAKFKVVPSDKTMGYYFDITRKEDFDAKNGDVADIVETIIKNYHEQQPGIPFEELIKFMCEHGDVEEEVEGFPAGTELVVFAIGVDEIGETYGTPAHKAFTTLPPGKPEDCKFNFEVKKLLSTSFTTVVKPTDRSIRYWTNIADPREWKGDQATFVSVKETLKKYAEEKGKTMEEVVAGVTFTGVREDEWGEMDGITRDTDYYVYAYAMDENGDPQGDMYKHKFTTRSQDLSMAEMKTAWQYFDGDALYASDSQKYPNAKGKVLVQVAAQPANNYTVDWFITLGPGAMMDPVTYPDDATKQAMMQAGVFHGQNRQQFWVDGFKECALLSFGLDEYGIDGLLKRESIKLTKEGVSPVDQVAPMKTSMSCLPFMVETVSVSRELRFAPKPVYIRASQMQF